MLEIFDLLLIVEAIGAALFGLAKLAEVVGFWPLFIALIAWN